MVDSSVVIQALTDSGSAFDQVADLLSHDRPAAPHLIDLEAANAIKGLERVGVLDRTTAEEMVRDVLLMPIRRYDHRLVLARCWQLRHNLSAYDASYVALSELLQVPLVTADAGLAAAPGIRCEVQLI